MPRRRQPQRRYHDPGADPRPVRIRPRTKATRERGPACTETDLARLDAAAAKRARKAQRRLTHSQTEES